jgi:hypothetical protein
MPLLNPHYVVATVVAVQVESSQSSFLVLPDAGELLGAGCGVIFRLLKLLVLLLLLLVLAMVVSSATITNTAVRAANKWNAWILHHRRPPCRDSPASIIQQVIVFILLVFVFFFILSLSSTVRLVLVTLLRDTLFHWHGSKSLLYLL